MGDMVSPEEAKKEVESIDKMKEEVDAARPIIAEALGLTKGLWMRMEKDSDPCTEAYKLFMELKEYYMKAAKDPMKDKLNVEYNNKATAKLEEIRTRKTLKEDIAGCTKDTKDKIS